MAGDDDGNHLASSVGDLRYASYPPPRVEVQGASPGGAHGSPVPIPGGRLMDAIRCTECFTVYDRNLALCPNCRYPTSFMDLDAAAVTTDTLLLASPRVAPGKSFVEVSPSEVEVVPHWRGVPGRVATVDVRVRNMSDRVDEFVVTVPNLPPWMQVAAGEVNLLPEQEGRVQLEVAARDGEFVAAGTTTLRVEVASENANAKVHDAEVRVVVPKLHADHQIEIVPKVSRGPASAWYRALFVNGTNAPVQVRFEGRDPTGVLQFVIRDAFVMAAAGSMVEMPIGVRGPAPTREDVTRYFSIVATDGEHEVTADGSLMIAGVRELLRLEPEALRGAGMATTAVQYFNGGAAPRTVSLRGSDSEGFLQFRFDPEVLQAPPNSWAVSRLVVTGPAPSQQPTSREFAVRTNGGVADLVATGRFVTVGVVQELQLHPEVQRGNHSATFTVLYRNDGPEPIQVALGARDPENALRFTFHPPVLQVPAAGSATAELRASGPLPVRELERRFTVRGIGGNQEQTASGTFVQSPVDLTRRRFAWRLALTLLGAALICLGVFVQWTSGPGDPRTGVEWDYMNFIQDGWNQTPPHPQIDSFDQLTSVGLLVLILGGLAALGVLTRTGRLTRVAAILAIVALVAFLVGFDVGPGDEASPAAGMFIVGIGAIVAFAGGMLARK